MKFCSQCGTAVEQVIPAGDNRLRFVCPSCRHIHYQNPLIVTGCVATWQDKLLMCRRAIEPRHGYWTVPAGFMENGETVAEGGARETYEEALAYVTTGSLLAIVDVIHARQVHLFYRGVMDKEEYGAGDESLETVLMNEEDIPWNDIAFPSVRFALEAFLADRKDNVERLHTKKIHWRKPAE